MTAVIPGFLIISVLVVMVLFVRVAWWGLPRFGEHFPWIAALGATLVVAAIAGLTRGPASADELLFSSPSTAWFESAVLATLVMLPVFGFAARSVLKRWERNNTGPSAADWLASIFAGILGLFAVVSLVIVLGVLVWR